MSNFPLVDESVHAKTSLKMKLKKNVLNTNTHKEYFFYPFFTLFYISVLLSPRDWIQALCAYTTSNFLRAGELGAEIGESWVVANAAIYLWNYNSHLLAAREYTRLLPTFQSLVDMLQKTGYTG